MMNFTKISKWSARILLIMIFILFSLFAFDEPVLSIGFLIHMIPSILILSLLVITWKMPNIGVIINICFGIGTAIFFKTYKDIITFLLLSVPFFITAALAYFGINKPVNDHKRIKLAKKRAIKKKHSKKKKNN